MVPLDILDINGFDSFLKLGESLRELEVTVGPKARPVIAEVRARLAEAAAKRESGDLPAAFATLRLAMQRLASLGDELDAEEGALMRLIAERFTQALNFGDKGAARDVVNFMRHKAGDPKDEDDW
jgi:hypothetical protein